MSQDKLVVGEVRRFCNAGSPWLTIVSKDGRWCTYTHHVTGGGTHTRHTTTHQAEHVESVVTH